MEDIYSDIFLFTKTEAREQILLIQINVDSRIAARVVYI